MKKHPILLAAFALLWGVAHGGMVTLTKDGVTSAVDIEAAINLATDFGTEPGLVILDGSEGEFVYTEADRSINVFVSHVALLGINDASIANCGDGLFFDDLPLSDIFIEGITFKCEGNGIADVGLSHHERVTVANNDFEAGAYGIILRNAVRWRICNNSIAGGTGPAQAAIALIGCKDSTIANNALTGFRGVALTRVDTLISEANSVVHNRIGAVEIGVLLDEGASRNKVVGNSISTAGTLGIFLGPDTSYNKVHGNRVSATSVGNVTAVQDLGVHNKVRGNRP